MKYGIDQPTLENTEQQQKDLIPSETDPLTPAFALVLLLRNDSNIDSNIISRIFTAKND